MVGDLSVANSHGVDRFELDGFATRGDAEEVALMGAVIGLKGGHDVAVDRLPMDLGPEVGKRFAQPVVEDANAGFVGCRAGLGSVVDESSSNNSSKRAKSPWPWTCSVLRRTTAFRASAWLWGDGVASVASWRVTACLSVESMVTTIMLPSDASITIRDRPVAQYELGLSQALASTFAIVDRL